MAAALKTTMKGTKHRWCRWHVLRKLKQHVGNLYSKHSAFKKEFNKLVTEETSVQRFERKWRQLLRKYNLMENKFMKRLYKKRGMWAKPYFMDIFCAGMTSTQRSESANHMIKRFIQRSAPMHMFVRKFSEFQTDRQDQEDKEIHVTKQMRRRTRVGVPIERDAEQIYTRWMYEKFYHELFESGGFIIKHRGEDGLYEVVHTLEDGNMEARRYKVRYHGGDEISCECGLYEHMGMLCRHSLKVLVNLDIKSIPRANIMARWSKCGSGGHGETSAWRDHISTKETTNFVKKRMLLKKMEEVAYGTSNISDGAFTEAMGALEAISATETAVTQICHRANQDMGMIMALFHVQRGRQRKGEHRTQAFTHLNSS